MKKITLTVILGLMLFAPTAQAKDYKGCEWLELTPNFQHMSRIVERAVHIGTKQPGHPLHGLFAAYVGTWTNCKTNVTHDANLAAMFASYYDPIIGVVMKISQRAGKCACDCAYAPGGRARDFARQNPHRGFGVAGGLAWD